MKIKMKFNTYFKAAKGRWQYKGNIKIMLNEIDYDCEILANTYPTDNKLRPYLNKVINLKNKSEVKDQKIKRDLNRSLYKLFLSIDSKIKKIEVMIEEKTNGASTTLEEFLSNTSKVNDIKVREFEVEDKITLIENDISNEDIEKISRLKSGENKLILSSTLNRLEKFRDEWKLLYENKTKEKEFQNKLIEYRDLFPILFGFSPVCQKEGKHVEGGVNLYDIEGDDWIIELKRPDTKLFNSSGNRKNIAGISSAFVSADNQLSLYIKKKNRERELTKSFIQGVLIIGSNSMIDNEDKTMAFDIMKEKSESTILTFSDITIIAEKNIKFYQK